MLHSGARHPCCASGGQLTQYGLYSYGIGPLSWIYTVEIFPNHLRSTGTTITTMASWIANFSIAQITPKAFQAIGSRYYLVFAVLSITNAITIWALFPETKGRRLEELHELFSTTGWFVPTSKVPRVSGKDVENRMRDGTLIPGRMEETADAGSIERSDSEKAEVKHI